MKQTFLSCGALALLGGTLMIPVSGSAATYGAAGCGLGSIVFADSPGIIQVVAATINATGIQTFGITSGTSNCGGAAAASLMQENFVAMNQSSLSRDAAAGSGEYLAALSTLIGCEADAQDEFFTTVQSKHAEIFTPDAKPADVVTNVKAAVAGNQKLNDVCKI